MVLNNDVANSDQGDSNGGTNTNRGEFNADITTTITTNVYNNNSSWRHQYRRRYYIISSIFVNFFRIWLICVGVNIISTCTPSKNHIFKDLHVLRNGM